MKRALPTGRRLLLTGVAAAALVAGGGAALAATADDDPAPKPATGATSAPDVRVKIEQAVTAALQAAPGTVVEADLDEENGKPVWQVEVQGQDGTKRELVVDATSGKVVQNEVENNDNDDNDNDDNDDDDNGNKGNNDDD
ncbi:Uncharacterized membrane protein YkoI [Thermomonospora echinospora]|uniref:Uncharacterized membrane protein YkoI n=1 Tax=Thermomonospora echinospora TaxID=1992 RepID=A0A1H5V2H2_9ACTN|nr:PepSY domain-containing protein [Thermomonospora echinospora]SEF81595.1 Uncharacterized membrane protein YkoI [Thermomonospora echinospora]